jgi:glutamate synthase (NADPH/NADH)
MPITSWADTLPEKVGLYDPEYEKDSCGVGFIVQIQGKRSHRCLSDAQNVLCNMTHRGASGADIRDGDGSGVMTGIPDNFFRIETKRDLKFDLPPEGQYAVGNLFMKADYLDESKQVFEQLAQGLDLKVLGWRDVPHDSTILGPAAKSKEPAILQPFVVANKEMDERQFERQLYVLRKHATHTITMKKWFYVCSLSNKNIVYKGQLTPKQVYAYFYDLVNFQYETHFALVHSRFSTNTFPSWDRAQPMRWSAHNGNYKRINEILSKRTEIFFLFGIGEINTLRGNKNWMRSREGLMKSDTFGPILEYLYPVIEEGGSDSAAFDNVLELLVVNGVLTLPEAVMVMIPEAWQNNPSMEPEKKEFYQWAATLMEPWDGPALFTFSDGRYIGASLDRNGLRPCRSYITTDNIMICASEVGTIPLDPEIIVTKQRLQPGKMLLVDTVEGRVVDDKELKLKTAQKANFGEWVKKRIHLNTLVDKLTENHQDELDPLAVNKDPRMRAFGYTLEQVNLLMIPLAATSKETLGSMGNDTALACLSKQPRLIYEYFRQLFAQVTNPPIDPIREEIVMSLECYVGPEGNLLEMNENQCHRLILESPILSMKQLSAIKRMEELYPSWKVATIDITFAKEEGVEGYLSALERACNETVEAINKAYKVVILSDRRVGPKRVAISSLIAMGGVHHHLVRNKLRSRVALMIESAEVKEVHHFCALLGYGADAICPYLAFEAMLKLVREGAVREGVTAETAILNYTKAVDNGIKKVMSKMGISTLASYKGAQIFEALGVDDSVISRCFVGTSSRIKGVTFDIFALDAITMHEWGYPTRNRVQPDTLPEFGEYHWRDGGEAHLFEPSSMANLQNAVRTKNKSSYDAYTRACYEAVRLCTLRGLLTFDYEARKPIPIEQVEDWTSIVKRFVTGAMSYGSISWETHTALAIAMNHLGGKSNTGEGGEKPERSQPTKDGGSMRSAIKQVASGRFGVTSFYLADAEELQIKMAQGAKPGEGGELTGDKVSEEIASTRKTTPGIGLISPPPHHDIYSIEDLKQLIYDLKCSNPRARISVKLVSEVGVGIVAAGVAKAKADHILISGHDGGTGASRWTGIKYAGLPWELGLAETHQTLVLNDLRGRVIVQTDGQIKTGLDIVIACLLGAEEWGFATTPLIALGCIMMRKCHLVSVSKYSDIYEFLFTSFIL